jgi:Protein of unknown function (DUF2283)
MRLEYDKEANARYSYLRGKIPEGGAARTLELAPGVYLDADRAGRLKQSEARHLLRGYSSA